MEEANILASIMDSKEDTKREEIDERDASRVDEPPIPETVVQSESDPANSGSEVQQKVTEETKPPNDDTMDVDKADSSEQVSSVEQKKRAELQQQQQEVTEETKPPNDDTMDVDKEDSSEQVSSVEQKKRAELQQQQQVTEVTEETKPPNDDTMDVNKEDSSEQVSSVEQKKRAELVNVAAATTEMQVIENETDVLSSEQDKMEEKETTNETSQKETEEEVEVQVLTPKQAEREWRRKRRRRLYKMLNHKTEKPSFLAILHQPIEISNDNDDDDSDIPVTRVVIDVDQYLGLSKLTPPPNVVSSNYPFTTTTTTTSTTHQQQTNNLGRGVPRAATSAPAVVTSSSTTTTNLVDEGFYEGVKVMGMPEDDIYISELQQWIRQNLEFFSATEMDAQMSQSGRRTRTVRGKVGVRCIHCARQLLPTFQSKFSSQGIKNEQWPPGSVSYPATIEGLYSSCSQRPQLHFESCPYLPHNVRMQGSQWLAHESSANELQYHHPQPPIKRRRRLKEGISAVMYYHIACQRIGLVEAPGGLRFSRDLSLEPLPLEEIKLKVEEEKPELISKPRQRQSFMNPDRATSSNAAAAAAAAAAISMGKTPCSNEECQKIIQEAVQEEDDLEKRLARKNDHTLVTDYTFLAIKQMAICHASPMDFVSRGKKTKLMRLGFAGFCCRHCDDQNIQNHACRSFSSAPDNLASAISNSFVLHLAKCPHTSTRVKQALIALRKIHGRQMQQLLYGSQRKCFFAMWNRMRAADKIVEGEETPNAEQLASATAATSSSFSRPDSIASTPIATAIESNRKNARSSSFAVSSNDISLKMLKEAEENWDPVADNDNLMEKDDRFLVSDYVFLTMRQLKLALPTSSDFRGNRRNNILQRMAGMCCKHCADTHAFVSSGRTFPSAPDNMASAFNTSLYNHMQNCPGVSLELKQAFEDLRKIHSMQCQNLVFGSQRKFFNKVYDKLKQIPIPKELLQPDHAGMGPASAASTAAARFANAKMLRTNSFVAGEEMGGFPPCYQCLQCRAVPFEFRAPGAVHNSRPTVLSVRQHSLACQKDGLFLGFVKRAKDVLLSAHKSLSEKKSFEELVGLVVGGDDELTRLVISSEDSIADTSGWWRRLPSNVEFARVQERFNEVAKELNLSSTRLQDHPSWARFLQLISPSLQIPVLQEQKPKRSGSDFAATREERPDHVESTSHAASVPSGVVARNRSSTGPYVVTLNNDSDSSYEVVV